MKMNTQKKKRIKNGLILTILMITVLFISACDGNDPEVESESSVIPKNIKIGAIPTQNQGDMANAMDKLGEHLGNELGTEVEITIYPDYNGVVEAMNYGQVDMAYFGPLTYVIANERGGAEAIMTLLVDDEPYYYSYIIAHEDSSIESFEDLTANAQDLEFAFGDVNSTSGSLIPTLALRDAGVFRDQLDSDFEEVFYTGGHDATALAVQEKSVDVGSVDSAIYQVMVENEVIDGEQLKVIWQSEPLFQYPWAVKEGTSGELIEALQDAFLKVQDPEILDVFGASGFAPASDEDYAPIREAAEADGRL